MIEIKTGLIILTATVAFYFVAKAIVALTWPRHWTREVVFHEERGIKMKDKLKMLEARLEILEERVRSLSWFLAIGFLCITILIALTFSIIF